MRSKLFTEAIFCMKMTSMICSTCRRAFKGIRGLNKHLLRSSSCHFVAQPTNEFVLCSRQTTNDDDNVASERVAQNDDHASIAAPVIDKTLVLNFLSSLAAEDDDTTDETGQDYLIDLMNNSKSDENESQFLSSQEKAYITLLQLLKKSRAPLYLFESIMKWAQVASQKFHYDFSRKYHPRRKVLQDLKESMKLSEMEPKIKRCNLSNGNVVDLTTFDFRDMLFSLLCDKNLMKKENLLFGDTPFEPLDTQHGKYADILSGSRYRECQEKMIQNPLRDVVVPVILFIDKTHTDRHGHLTLEPVMFTLGIFNWTTRNSTMAWRKLGYIPNQSIVSPDDDSSERAQNYHLYLDTILYSFREVQKQGGLNWPFQYGDVTYNVRFKLPLFLAMGDTEGLDKLCGKYLVRTLNVKRGCRRCNIPTNKLDDELFEMELTKQQDITKLVQRHDTENLKAISYHYLENAFNDIDFGGCRFGINGNTCYDCLHTIQQGLMEYATQAFFIVQKKEYANRKYAGYDNTPVVINEKQGSNTLSKYHVFSSKRKKQFNALAKRYGQFLQHQSNRDLPRTYFPQGVSESSKISAHEQAGVILLNLFLVCTFDFGRKLAKEMGEHVLAGYIQLLELILMYEQVLKKVSFTKSYLNDLEKSIPIFLELYKRVVNRREGMEMKIVKFHASLHLVNDIKRFGAPRNWDTGSCEKGHKVNAKDPAKGTQRQYKTFELQSATRYWENINIEHAYQTFGLDTSTTKKKRQEYDIEISAQKYFCDRSGRLYLYDEPTKQLSWPDTNLQSRLEAMLANDLIPQITQPFERINMFSAFRMNDQIFRACPDYPSNEWRDWALVEYDGGDVFPAHLVVILDLRFLDEGVRLKVNGTLVNAPGHYVVIESIDKPLINCESPHTNSVLIKWAQKQMPTSNCAKSASRKRKSTNDCYEGTRFNEGPILSLSSIQGVVRDLVAVPDDNEDFPHSYLFLTPRDLWSGLFIPCTLKSELLVATEEVT